MGRKNKNGKPAPVFLKPGDVMRLGVDGLGEQHQHVVAYRKH
jgi:2-keto-4-pentenoate hydratase/2-oxohepta-3-ene-1,7-dioic acid hydratase in catechol pathway